MNRADDLRRVTHLFPTFLGLRLVPFGLWFLAIGLTSPLVNRISNAVHLVVVALVIAAIWRIHRWYRREYGTVEPERLGLGRNWPILGGWVAALVVFGLGAAQIGDDFRLVLLLVLVLFATVVLFALPRAFGPDRLLTAVVPAVALVAGAGFVYLALDPARFASIGSLFSSTLGILFCLAGWIEHRQMTRAMEQLASGDDV